MRKYIIYFILISNLAFAQDEFDDKSIYTNTNTLEIFTNKESGYSDQDFKPNVGFGFEISTFHGVFVFRHLAISGGIGIAFNVNEDFKSIPIVGDVKFYLNPYGINSLYVLLNAGRNLKLDSFLAGQTSKFGLGYTFESDYDVSYVMEVFIKSKEFTIDKATNYNYQMSGLGLALGIKF
jgi:hypothetical protein